LTFARIGIFETGHQPVEPILLLFRDKVTPAFERLGGFLGYQAFVEDDCRYIGISYWTSLAALEASDEVAGWAREEAAKLGAKVVGTPIIVRQEFDTR